jgi:predicted nucleotidyltransferase
MSSKKMRRKKDIETAAAEVLRRYPVKKAALFGSAARELLTDKSDVDIIVEFSTDRIGLDFFGLRLDLEEALSLPVDLITFDSLKASKNNFRARVESEAHVFYELQTI